MEIILPSSRYTRRHTYSRRSPSDWTDRKSRRLQSRTLGRPLGCRRSRFHVHLPWPYIPDVADMSAPRQRHRTRGHYVLEHQEGLRAGSRKTPWDSGSPFVPLLPHGPCSSSHAPQRRTRLMPEENHALTFDTSTTDAWPPRPVSMTRLLKRRSKSTHVPRTPGPIQILKPDADCTDAHDGRTNDPDTLLTLATIRPTASEASLICDPLDTPAPQRLAVAILIRTTHNDVPIRSSSKTCSSIPVHKGQIKSSNIRCWDISISALLWTNIFLTCFQSWFRIPRIRAPTVTDYLFRYAPRRLCMSKRKMLRLISSVPRSQLWPIFCIIDILNTTGCAKRPRPNA